MGLETTHQQKRNPRIHRVLQLLSTVYRRIQQGGQTPIRKNQERHHMGMGGQGTGSLWRVTTGALLNPGVDILQAREATTCRNRGLEIRLLRNNISTWRRRKMEANSVSVENHGACQMQLRRTRKRTISYISSTPGMEKIPQGKWTTFPSPNWPQAPNKVYDNKTTDRTTNRIERSLEQLRLQNWIPTW